MTTISCLFRDYVLIGGMPEIAASYLRHRDLGRLARLYEGLLVSYADDAAKYGRSTTQLGHLRHVIETAPLRHPRKSTTSTSTVTDSCPSR